MAQSSIGMPGGPPGSFPERSTPVPVSALAAGTARW